jgi:putative inorganic carbon (HCO3(-)) transporter
VALQLTEARARSIAALGLILLIAAVTATGRSIGIGPVSADVIVLGAPLAILMCLPYVRSRGVGSAPAYLLGPAALVFLLMALLSVAWNGAHADSYLTIVRYTSYILLAFVVSIVTQDSSFRRLILWALALSCAVTTLFAFWQFLHPPPFTPGMIDLGEEIKTRVVGTFYNANFYAEYLLLMAGVVLALVLTEKGWARLIAIAIGGVGVAAFFLTYTRGSWVGLAVGLVVFIVLTDVRYLALLAVGGIAVVVAVPGVLARLTASEANDSSAGFRLALWKVAGEAIRRHPALGVGIGDFLAIYREVVTTRPDLYVGYLGFGAHNAYFALSAEIGVIGGLAFLVLTVGYATRGLFVATRAGISREVKYTALGLSVGLVGFVANTFTSNTFQHPQPALFFWLLSGIVAGLGAGLWQADIRPQRSVGEVGQGLVRGSVLALWVSRARAATDSLWRQSFVFSRVAVPKKPQDGWFTSSVFIRTLFGSAGVDDSKSG